MMKKYEKHETEKTDSRIIAKERLKRTIQSERAELPEDVMAMMQSDLKELIERYLGDNAKDTDLILEVQKPAFSTVIPWHGGDVNLKEGG